MMRWSKCPQGKRLGWAAVCLAAVVLGCSSGAQRSARQREESGLKALAILYMQFAGQHQGKGPANEALFKAFLRTLPEEQRKSLNISDVDAIFVSPRDGKPYVFVYGAKRSAAPSPKASGAPVVGYEQVGVGGRRYVANALGAVEEVDEAAFKQQVPDAKTP